MSSYSEKLQSRIDQIQSHLCVGIDPRAELLGEESLEAFTLDVIESCSPYAAAFKPNMAYYEAFGAEGVAVLERCLPQVPKEIPVVLDAKRSDIPETMKYYAEAYFGRWDVDAVTINAFMGFDSLEPFLQDESKGIYLLAVTSNPGSRDLELKQAEGKYVFEWVQEFALQARELPGEAGLVLGCTTVGPELLEKVADLPLLIPGLGAQGGSVEGLDLPERNAPVLVNSSRSILYGAEGSRADRAAAARQKIEAIWNPV